MTVLTKRPYYYSSLRKYVIMFGDLFSGLDIIRASEDAQGAQEFTRERVPISYGKKEKFYTRNTQDPDLTKLVAIKLPRLAFELKELQYDASRKLNNYLKMSGSSNGLSGYQYTPVPYNMTFSLDVICKNTQEANQIAEQIIPLFTPDVTINLNMLPFLNHQLKVPVVLNGVSMQDTYEGDMESPRRIEWNMIFTVKGYLYGPTRGRLGGSLVTDDGIIRRTDINYYDITTGKLLLNEHTELTHPTIPQDQITEEDDYGFEVTFNDQT